MTEHVAAEPWPLPSPLPPAPLVDRHRVDLQREIEGAIPLLADDELRELHRELVRIVSGRP